MQAKKFTLIIAVIIGLCSSVYAMQSAGTTDDNQCNVCFDPVTPKLRLMLDCNHLFDKNCLHAWYAASKGFAPKSDARENGKRCPVCKCPFSEKVIMILDAHTPPPLSAEERKALEDRRAADALEKQHEIDDETERLRGEEAQRLMRAMLFGVLLGQQVADADEHDDDVQDLDDAQDAENSYVEALTSVSEFFPDDAGHQLNSTMDFLREGGMLDNPEEHREDIDGYAQAIGLTFEQVVAIKDYQLPGAGPVV